MMERYETEFDIFDHDTAPPEEANDSLSLLKFRTAEDPLYGSYWQKRMYDYTEYEVQKFMGLNFDEFLARPRHLLELMLSHCSKLQAEENERESKKLRDIQQQHQNSKK